MTWEQTIKEERKEAYQEAKEEISIANAKNLYKNCVAIIAKSLGMSLEKIKEITKDITVKV